ncbi:hypothetical protein LCGC14_1254110 [marine sediment metagenome]|uniref:Uncharacterized protein n=1 Tax=marine sediment metagenome TaxID=412755 RepID=A0A0F9L2K1_9ZZZZ
MKYDDAKRELEDLGAEFLSRAEMRSRLPQDVSFFSPIGCLQCGSKRFTDVLYFLADQPDLFYWAQGECGVTLSVVNYGSIARCLVCDGARFEIDVE